MKKLFVGFAILLSLNFSYGNPIAEMATISELTFDQNGKWSLEINCIYIQEITDSDRLFLESSAGKRIINLHYAESLPSILVITSDSLDSPLEINPDGDFIRLITYLDGGDYPSIEFEDVLTFGDYPDSRIEAIPQGYSIARVSNYWGDNSFSRDKTPTMGVLNDTSGTMGTLKGKIYDKNGEQVVNATFGFEGPFDMDNEGNYSAKLLSNRIKAHHIFNYLNSTGTSYNWLAIDTINIDIYPDSVYEANIYLQEDYVAGINDETLPEDFEIKIINYPNPFNSTTSFVVQIPDNLLNEERKVDIYTVNGEKINSINFSGSLKAAWNGNDFSGNSAASGIYYYQLVIGNKVSANGSMILMK